jgi:hypothetical protein
LFKHKSLKKEKIKKIKKEKKKTKRYTLKNTTSLGGYISDNKRRQKKKKKKNVKEIILNY